MEKRKKILWFVSEFKNPGGGERYILEAINVLKEKKVDIIVVCHNYNEKVLFGNKYKVNVIEVGKKNYKKKKNLSYYCDFIYDIFLLKKCLNEINPDLVLCQDYKGILLIYASTLMTKYKYSIIDFGQLYQLPSPYIIYSLTYSRNTKYIKNEIEKKGELLPEKVIKGELINKLSGEIKALFLFFSHKHAYKIYVLSEKVKKENRLIYNKNSILLRGAYDESIFGYKQKKDFRKKYNVEGNYVVLVLGRLVKHKRVDVIIDAFLNYRVRYDDKDAVLIIAGEGLEMESLMQKVPAEVLNKFIFFIGFVNENELLDIYCSCDLFVTMDPADYDIAVYTAIALRKKVLVPKIMSFDNDMYKHDLINSVEPNILNISKKIHQIKNRKTKKSSNEINFYEMMKKYTWSSCFEEIYKNI